MADGPVPVGLIAVTRYEKDARWDPRRCEQGEGALLLLEHAIPVCLGTDGGCTNSRQSIFEEMRMAALMAKARAADASALGADETLLMGTARGGEVLGLPVGRIAPDHAADLVVVDLGALSVQPSRTATKQIVYSMQPDAIRRVLVGGETVVEDGRLTRVDEREIAAKVKEVTANWEPASRHTAVSRVNRSPGIRRIATRARLFSDPPKESQPPKRVFFP